MVATIYKDIFFKKKPKLFRSEFFPINLNYFNPAKNGGKSTCIQVFNRSPSSIFWWLSSANHIKFTEECVISDEMQLYIYIYIYIYLLFNVISTF